MPTRTFRSSFKRILGFTLVEVLIALALLALMGGLSWQGLDGMLKSRQALETHHHRNAELSAVLAQWRADLDAALWMPGLGLSTGIDWDGRVLRMTRRSTELMPDGSDPGLWVVGWRWQAASDTAKGESKGEWQRWQSPPLRDTQAVQNAWDQAGSWAQNAAPNSGQDASARETRLMPLAGWQLYFYRDNAWSNPLSSAGNANKPQANPMPDAIRLVLLLPTEWGSITVDWLRPNWIAVRS
jgi:general secretion pathway protein J